jgi:hypothetical protein
MKHSLTLPLICVCVCACVCVCVCMFNFSCYAKQFGPKGFGIGSQSLTYTGVSVSDSSAGAKSPAASSGSSTGGAAKFCTNCGTGGQTGKFCGSCGKPVGGAAVSSSSPSPPAPAAAAAASSPVSQGAFSPNRGGIQRPGQVSVSTTSTKCGACNTTVYEAEKVVGGGRVWHQACFRCSSCRAGLSSTNLNDKDGKVYCTACYGKNFGPKGFGFAGGAAGLMSS